MALSLVLRSASKIQGYPCILRCTPTAFKNAVNVSYLTSSAHSSASQKKSSAITNQIITTPAVRCMSSSDHRLLWTVERILSLGLVGVLPLTVATPHPILDNAAAVMMVLHFHWGVEAMVQDYVRPIIFGNVIPKVSLVAVYVLSAVTLGGLMYFNYNDVGIGKAVRSIWSIQPAD